MDLGCDPVLLHSPQKLNAQISVLFQVEGQVLRELGFIRSDSSYQAFHLLSIRDL